MITQAGSELRLTPFKQDFFKDIKIALIVAVIGGIAGFFLEKPRHQGIAWGFALCAAGLMLWNYVTKYHQAVVFALDERKIYRHNWWGKKSLLNFDEADFSLQIESAGIMSAEQAFYLVHKKDRYKPVQRISPYLSEADMPAFEEQVLKLIGPLLTPASNKPKATVNNASFSSTPR